MKIAPLISNKNNYKNKLQFGNVDKNTVFIFDWDGTLIDSAPLQKTAWQQTADRVAKNYSRQPISVDEYYNHGMSRNDNLKVMFYRLGLSDISQDIKTSYGKVKAELYDALLLRIAKEEGPDSLLIKGARQFLENIKRVFPDSKLIVASSAIGAVSAINAAQLDNFFSKSNKPSTVIDGTDKGFLYNASKPEPDIFLAAAKLQNASPENCIVFEDSIVGVEAASRAGMKFVLIGDLHLKANYMFEFMLGKFKDFTKINMEEFMKLVRNNKKI